MGGNYRKRPPAPRRDSSDKLSAALVENLPTLKKLLEGMAGSQDRLATAEEARVRVEERKAEAMHKIAGYLEGLMTRNDPPQADIPPPALAMAEPFLERTSGSYLRLPADLKTKILQIIKEMREEGLTYDEIARHLEQRNIPTFSGKGRWHGQTVNKLFKQAET